MAVYKRGNVWWYKFTFRGEPFRESTRQRNKRVAEQMEAAHRTALAKGEVGIRERKPIPTLRDFANRDFLPYVASTFAAKIKTQRYYENGVKNLLAFEALASEQLDRITSEQVGGYVSRRQRAGLQVSSINRELQVLRRMFNLAQEWGKVEKVLPKVKMLPGERHRERVLSADEEQSYLGAAKPLLRDVATVLIDCGLRPEECFRLRWENVSEEYLEVQHGKTAAARRRIPLSQRVAAVLAMRRSRPRFGMGLLGSHQERAYRAVQPQEAARPRVPGRRSGALRAVLSAAHLPDPLGSAHGPVDIGLFGGSSRHGNHQEVRPSAGGDRSLSDGAGARSCTGWAQNWAQ